MTREIGAALFVLGIIGFGLTVSAFIVPLALRAVPEQERSLANLLETVNLLTGHALVEEAAALVGRGVTTRARLRLAVVIEVALFAAVPIVAAISR